MSAATGAFPLLFTRCPPLLPRRCRAAARAFEKTKPHFSPKDARSALMSSSWVSGRDECVKSSDRDKLGVFFRALSAAAEGYLTHHERLCDSNCGNFVPDPSAEARNKQKCKQQIKAGGGAGGRGQGLRDVDVGLNRTALKEELLQLRTS